MQIVLRDIRPFMQVVRQTLLQLLGEKQQKESHSRKVKTLDGAFGDAGNLLQESSL